MNSDVLRRTALAALIAMAFPVVGSEPAGEDEEPSRDAAAAETGAAETESAPEGLDPEVAKAASDAAAAYLLALKVQGFNGASEHLHPDALERFKGMTTSAFDSEEEKGTRTLLNATFGRDAAFMDARMAPPGEYFSRFARLASVRLPELTLGFDSSDPIGVLPDGEHVHVLVRLHTGEGAAASERLAVVSLARDGDDWKALLDARLVEMARSLAGQTDRDRHRPDRPLIGPLPEGTPLQAPPGQEAPLGAFGSLGPGSTPDSEIPPEALPDAGADPGVQDPSAGTH